MDYRPYSPEWHRRRHLKEALDRYLDDYVDTDTIRQDLLSILSERSDKAYEEFMRINQLEKALQWVNIISFTVKTMNPDDITLDSTCRMFEYEKLSREIEVCEDMNELRNMCRCFVKLHLKHQEVAAQMMIPNPID